MAMPMPPPPIPGVTGDPLISGNPMQLMNAGVDPMAGLLANPEILRQLFALLGGLGGPAQMPSYPQIQGGPAAGLDPLLGGVQPGAPPGVPPPPVSEPGGMPRGNMPLQRILAGLGGMPGSVQRRQY